MPTHLQSVITSSITNMGLEGVVECKKMNSFNNLSVLGGASTLSYLGNGLDYCASGLMSECNAEALALPDFSMDVDEAEQLPLLLQAQALIQKSQSYQQIDEAMKRAHIFYPNLQYLPQSPTDDDEERVCTVHRDAAASNLRFLNMFYGYSPSSFALAVNLMDRMLSRQKMHPRYLSCVATACFYIAIKTVEDRRYIPAPHELVKLSQCGGTATDLQRMERIILEKLEWQLNAVTPVTFLRHFSEVIGSKSAQFKDHSVLIAMIAKLEVLMCQHEFASYRAETLALALLSCIMQEMNLLANPDFINTVLELQLYCQIPDVEFLQCRSLVLDYLAVYKSQRSKRPRLQLIWTVSRRTMNKMKPSTRVLLDLETIMEDEDDETTDESDDAAPFDSDNDNDMVRGHFMTCRRNAQRQLPSTVDRADNKKDKNSGDASVELSFMTLHSKDEK